MPGNNDNHANQMNPNNDAYWQSRGHDERPDDWEEGDSYRGDQRQLLLPVPSIILAGSPPVPGSVFEPLRFDSWGRRIPG